MQSVPIIRSAVNAAAAILKNQSRNGFQPVMEDWGFYIKHNEVEMISKSISRQNYCITALQCLNGSFAHKAIPVEIILTDPSIACGKYVFK